MITSAGIGSGLDIEGLITKLVSAEGTPVAQRYDRQEAGFQAELSGLGLVKSSLSQFQSAIADLKNLTSFQPRTATSSDTTVFDATATNIAVAGNYQVQVNAVAAAHKVRSAGVATSSTDVGTGTLTITINSESFNLTIDDSNKTLGGIRDAINNATDNKGVSATIVNVDNGGGGTESRLVLTSTNTGTAHDINVTAVDDDANNTDASGLSLLASNNLTQITASANASIQVDGQTITRSTNTITDAIDGITLTLKKSDVGVNKTLAVALDDKSVKDSVNKFVSAYNDLQSTFKQVTFYDATTKKSGVLIGDSTVRNISSLISQQVVKAVPAVTSGFNSLSAIGIKSNAEGVYSLDSTVFDAALASNFDDIGKVFADSTDGIAVKLDTVLDSYLKTDGIMQTRTDGIQSSIDLIADSRARLNDRLIKIEARYRKEFTALDALVANFQATSNFLTQQLASLPGFTRPTKK